MIYCISIHTYFFRRVNRDVHTGLFLEIKVYAGCDRSCLGVSRVVDSSGLGVAASIGAYFGIETIVFSRDPEVLRLEIDPQGAVEAGFLRFEGSRGVAFFGNF